jgi:AraC-like DNA-binding protein
MTPATALPFSQTGTRLMPGRSGVAGYAEAIEPVFDVRLRDVDDAGPDLNIEAYNVGSLLLGQAHMSGGRYVYGRDQRKIAVTALDHVLVQIITDGGDRRTTGRDPAEAAPGDVCLVDLTRPFRSETAHCVNYSLAVPRALLGRGDGDVDKLHGLILRGDSTAGRLMRSHVDTLWALAPRMTLTEAPSAGRATIDLLNALALPRIESATAAAAVENAHLLRLKRHIEAHLGDPALGPEHLCKSFGLSRASLYRLFSPMGGVSDHIRRRRLQKVFVELTDPASRHKTMGQIADAYGFSRWSAFARAFQARFDMAPGEARALALDAERRASALTEASGETLPDWLRFLDPA